MDDSFPTTDEIRAASTRELCPADVQLIYLFGSLAKGRQRTGSDIDIAFLPLTLMPPLGCFEAAQRLSDELHAEVDLVDLSRATTVMRKEVVATGLLLYSSSLFARCEFEMRTFADYARLNEERLPVLHALGSLH